NTHWPKVPRASGCRIAFPGKDIRRRRTPRTQNQGDATNENRNMHAETLKNSHTFPPVSRYQLINYLWESQFTAVRQASCRETDGGMSIRCSFSRVQRASRWNNRRPLSARVKYL